MSIKNDNINLPATSLTASIANAAALVEHEPRRLEVALVYLCAHEELRDAGTVKDLARRPSEQRAAPHLRCGMAAPGLSKPLQEGEWTHHCATQGFALAAPMDRGANLGLASFAVAASPRNFEATVESTLKVLTKSTAYNQECRTIVAI